MKTRLLIIVCIITGFVLFGIFIEVNTPIIQDASQFEYDKSCFTEFWTETDVKPNHLLVKSILQKQLHERIAFDISLDEITIYDKGSEFVVHVPGGWNGRSPVVLVVKDTLENIDGIIRVKNIKILCE